MQTREKILIINALHRYAFYERRLQLSVVEANRLGGPEYILRTIDFDPREGKEQALEQVAKFTAIAAVECQPIKIYQCVDYNEGFSCTTHCSLEYLTTYNQRAGLVVPIIFILDGSNLQARQQAETQYGTGDYRNLILFLSKLRGGLKVPPSPNITEEKPEPQTRATSAPSMGVSIERARSLTQIPRAESTHETSPEPLTPIGNSSELKEMTKETSRLSAAERINLLSPIPSRTPTPEQLATLVPSPNAPPSRILSPLLFGRASPFKARTPTQTSSPSTFFRQLLTPKLESLKENTSTTNPPASSSPTKVQPS